jgi:probable FeS assembly SUF system protein SufT
MDSGRYDIFELPRSCQATVIPGGQLMLLEEGEQVVVTQTLGGSATVQTSIGYLVRISPEDSAAFGLAAPVADTVLGDGVPFDMEQVMGRLKNVFDPEIPINVVDLGLIYGCEALLLDDGSYRIDVKMSMTAPGCGMGDVLKNDAQAEVKLVAGVSEADVELVWDPPWSQDRMSDAARLQLGMF